MQHERRCSHTGSRFLETLSAGKGVRVSIGMLYESNYMPRVLCQAYAGIARGLSSSLVTEGEKPVIRPCGPINAVRNVVHLGSWHADQGFSRAVVPNDKVSQPRPLSEMLGRVVLSDRQA